MVAERAAGALAAAAVAAGALGLGGGGAAALLDLLPHRLVLRRRRAPLLRPLALLRWSVALAPHWLRTTHR